MADKLLTFKQFDGGLDLQTDTYSENLRFADACENVRVDETTIKSMAGYTKQLETATGYKVVGAYEYTKQDTPGSTPEKLFVSGGKIYRLDGNSFTTLYTGIDADARVFFITFNYVCLIMNGVDSLLQYNGTTVQPVVILDRTGNEYWLNTKPAFAALSNQCIFYGGDPAQPDRVFKSKPGSYTDFNDSEAGAFDIYPGYGGKVTWLQTFQDGKIIAYKNNAIYQISGSQPSTIRVDLLTGQLGCISGWTVQQVSMDQIFLSDQGLFSLTTATNAGNIRDAILTRKVKPLLDNLNKATATEAYAVYIPSENHYYLHYPSGSSAVNNSVLVLNTSTGGLMTRSGIVTSIGAIMGGRYYTGDYTGNIHRQLDGDSYDGQPIKTLWRSKVLITDSLSILKSFFDLKIILLNPAVAKLNIAWSVKRKLGEEKKRLIRTIEDDITNAWDVSNWDELIWDAGQDEFFHKHRLGKGATFQLELSNNAVNEPWAVNRIELITKMQGNRTR